MSDRLLRPFFNRPTLTVAKDLIGKRMVFEGYAGIITETEAYVGSDDPACHAARGMTKRNAVMFGPAGVAYVYLIYGMYHCLNFVTEDEGFPAAVLIRGLKLESGDEKHLDGPGKLCRDTGITRDHDGIDITSHKSFYVETTAFSLPVETSPRIGISTGTDLPWRFVVSKKKVRELLG